MGNQPSTNTSNITESIHDSLRSSVVVVPMSNEETFYSKVADRLLSKEPALIADVKKYLTVVDEIAKEEMIDRALFFLRNHRKMSLRIAKRVGFKDVAEKDFARHVAKWVVLMGRASLLMLGAQTSLSTNTSHLIDFSNVTHKHIIIGVAILAVSGLLAFTLYTRSKQK